MQNSKTLKATFSPIIPISNSSGNLAIHFVSGDKTTKQNAIVRPRSVCIYTTTIIPLESPTVTTDLRVQKCRCSRGCWSKARRQVSASIVFPATVSVWGKSLSAESMPCID